MFGVRANETVFVAPLIVCAVGGMFETASQFFGTVTVSL